MELKVHSQGLNRGPWGKQTEHIPAAPLQHMLASRICTYKYRISSRSGIRNIVRKLTVNKRIRKGGEERAATYLQEPVTLISQCLASHANTRRYIIQFWSDCIGFRMAKPWEHASSCHDHDYTIANCTAAISRFPRLCPF